VEFVACRRPDPLAQAAVYIALAPKSNSAYLALDNAMAEVESGPAREVPNHLKRRDPRPEGARPRAGLQYPHDFPGHHIAQSYWPIR